MVIRSGAILGAVLLAACVLSAPSHAALGVFEDPAPLAAKGGFQPDEVVVRVHGKAALAMAGVRAGRSSASLLPASIRHASVLYVRPAFAARATPPRSPATRVPTAALQALRDVFVLELEPGSDVLALAAELDARPEIVYAEPNVLYRVNLPLPPAPAEVDDPFVSGDGRNWTEGSWGQSFPDLWGLRSLRALESWERFDLDGNGEFGPGERRPGEGVLVAVVDTGVDFRHPDLAGAIWQNPGEIPDNGIDDDANGFVDDVQGWDFDGRDAIAEDASGHGTHVAAIIAARTGDAFGIAGVAPWSQILPVKGLADNGSGNSVVLANAVRYAADNGAQIISNSWGGGSASSVVAASFAYARSRGVLLVASAGNSVANVEGITPASLPGVIAVAALAPDHHAASFTNFGERVDISAPGVEILSASAGAGDNRLAAARPEKVVGAEHLRLDGTSMAAPQVSGALAVLRSGFPAESPEASVGRLLAAAAPLEDPDPELDGQLGFGRVDLLAALEALPQPLVEVVEWRVDSLQPGGRSEVVVVLRNRWQGVTGLEALLSVSDPGASITQGRVFLGDLEGGAEISNTEAPFVLEVDASVDFGVSLQLELQLHGDSGFARSFQTWRPVSFFRDLGASTGLPLSGDPLPNRADFADYDGDGRSDLQYVTQSFAQLFRQSDPGRFENASFSSGLFAVGRGLSQGLFFDSDDDGDLDAFIGSVTDETPSRFFRNVGAGFYEDQSEVLGAGPLRSFSAVALDYDLDGVTDFFGAANGDFLEDAPRREASFLLRGDGAGGFEEVTATTCLPDTLSMVNGQTLTLDYDGDGDADIAQVSGSSPLAMYRNDSDGRFTDVSRKLGLRRSLREEVRCQVQVRLGGEFCDRVAGRALAAGDYDADGDIDLFVTGRAAGASRLSTLYRNERGRRFVDVSAASGDLAESTGATHWGTAFFDFDNDGDLDLYRTDSRSGRGAAYTLYRNQGRGRFEAANREAFPRFPLGLSPQGGVAAIGDYDADGALDIFAAASILFGPARSAFLQNLGARRNHWLRVRLVGTASARDAFGARVTLETDLGTQLREVHHSPLETQPLHFGLGAETEIDSLEVRWPSGLVQELRDVRPDQLLTIEEPAQCLGGRRGKRECRRVDFEERPDPPRRPRVPRWVREQLEKDFICEREVEALRITRRVCGELARECLRGAGVPVTRRMLRRGWRHLPPERLECVLPYTSTVGCEETPRAELLDVCDCFDLPEEEEEALPGEEGEGLLSGVSAPARDRGRAIR